VSAGKPTASPEAGGQPHSVPGKGSSGLVVVVEEGCQSRGPQSPATPEGAPDGGVTSRAQGRAGSAGPATAAPEPAGQAGTPCSVPGPDSRKAQGQPACASSSDKVRQLLEQLKGFTPAELRVAVDKCQVSAPVRRAVLASCGMA